MDTNTPIEKEGKDEAKKETIKKEELDKTRLESISRASRVLTRVSTAFPFDIFPTTVVVEDAKITVILRSFFLSEHIRTFDVADVSGVFVGTGPFLASVEIVSKNFIENNLTIKNFLKKDAIKLRNIIEGIRTLTKEHIDTKAIDKKIVLDKINSFAKGL